MSSKKGKDTDAAVVEDTTRTREDIDAQFKETVTRAITKVVVKEEVEKPTMDDQNKTFRTRLVACWMLSNAALAIAIENINGIDENAITTDDQKDLRKKQNTYFAFILYATFGLSLVRFLGVSFSVVVMGSHVERELSTVLVVLVQEEPVPLVQTQLSAPGITFRYLGHPTISVFPYQCFLSGTVPSFEPLNNAVTLVWAAV